MIRHSFAIYWRLLLVQLRSQMNYRVSFLLDTGATCLIIGLEFGAVALVLQRFGTVQGWAISEIAILYGLSETAFGLMDLVFSGFQPRGFGENVRKGAFDQLLLRPVNMTAQVMGSVLELRRIAKVVMGLAILSYGFTQTAIAWTALKGFLLVMSMVGMFGFFGGLYVIGATVTFWTVESIEAINILTYGGREMISYPMSIYHRTLRRFFTFVIPAIFLSYFPVLYLLDKADPLGFPAAARYASPFVGLGMLVMAFAFWRFGIKRYQSTGRRGWVVGGGWWMVGGRWWVVGSRESLKKLTN